MADAKAAAAAVWAKLNERQQHYLLVLYRADQAAEAENKAAWSTGARARPASEWRWLRYGYVNVNAGAPRGTLQRDLDGARRRDQGAGATLAVLERAGLIQTRHDELSAAAAQALWCRDDTYHLSLQLTRTGRAAARAGGVDDLQPGRPPKGLLSEWLWGVLVDVWRAGDAGVKQSRSYTAWRYLEERRDGALVDEHPEHPSRRYRLSDAGRAHYRTHWGTYARLYPGIAARHPDGEPVWPGAVDARLRTLGAAAQRIGYDLQDVITEHDQLTSTAVPDPPAGTDVPELATAHTLRRARHRLAEQHRTRRLALLAGQVDPLRQLYRQAAARYAAAALAVTDAVITGADPAAALDAAATVPLRDDGRPAELACPVIGLAGIDADIATRHQAALTGPPPPRARRGRGRARAYEPPPPVDAPAHDIIRFADHLAGLVHAGQLTRLRMRVLPQNSCPPAGLGC